MIDGSSTADVVDNAAVVSVVPVVSSQHALPLFELVLDECLLGREVKTRKRPLPKKIIQMNQ